MTANLLDSLGVLNPVGRLKPTRPPRSDRDGRRGVSDRLFDLGIYVALVVLILYFWRASPYFLTQRNLLNVGAAVAVTGVLAAGMTIALIAGQLDLTVGANIALTSVVVGVQESERVLRLVRDLRDSGKAIILISHNLQQVWPTADRIMVMHLGRVAGIRRRAESTVEEIVKLIVYGRPDDADKQVPA